MEKRQKAYFFPFYGCLETIHLLICIFDFGNCKNIFSVDEPGNIIYAGLHGKYVKFASGEIVTK